MERRTFLKTGAAASLGVMAGCAPRTSTAGLAGWRAAGLVPPDVAWDRIIRTTVGLRPFRESGFRLEVERLDDRTVIHNYGHGGAGMSLSWGTAHLAADLALGHTERRAAVIGCGIVGLTAARLLQRRGFDVTIYAAALPPDTTSNMSWAGFTPASGVVAPTRRTAEWDARFRRVAAVAYREHQLLVGRGYGVSWIDEFGPTDRRGGGSRGGAGPAPMVTEGLETGSVVLGPGEHPFPTRYARWRPTLRFEPSIYLDALLRDVLAFDGRVVFRSFDTPRDLMTLPESLVVNCTGLGAKALFGDPELTPVKGQLVVLVPQPEINWSARGMLPRRDGIVLGHVMQRDEWSLEVDEEAKRRVMESHMELFGAMRWPDPPSRSSRGRPGRRPADAPSHPPPVEAFFDRSS